MMSLMEKLYLRIIRLLGEISFFRNLKNGFYYFAGTLLQFFLAIFTQPIFSKYLELSDFAIIGYYSALQALLLPLFTMTLPFFYLAKYWKPDGAADKNQNLTQLINFLNIANALIAIVSFLLLKAYFKFFSVNFELLPYTIIILVNLYFEKYKTFYLLECRVKKNGLKYFLINLSQILLTMGFSLLFVVKFNGGAAGRMSGNMVGTIITAALVIILLLKEKIYRFRIVFDKTKIIESLKYSWPLIIGAYAYYPIGNIDRLYLEGIGDTNEFGYYNIGLTIATFIGTFFLAIYQSFEPDLYKLINTRSYKRYFKYLIVYFLLVSVTTVIFILFSEPLVNYLTSGRYIRAAVYANILIISIALLHLANFFEQLFTAYGATNFIMVRNIIMGLFCLAFYYVMIHNYQFLGANISRVVSSIFFIFLNSILFIVFYRYYNDKARKKYF